MRKAYGLDEAALVELERRHRGRCAICQRQGKHLGIDHDHETKKVRGMLCRGCNRAIGYFIDSPALLRRAADYLERSE